MMLNSNFNERDTLAEIFNTIPRALGVQKPHEFNEVEQIEEHIETNCDFEETYSRQKSPETRAIVKCVFSKLRETVHVQSAVPAASTSSTLSFSKSTLPRRLHSLCPLESIA